MDELQNAIFDIYLHRLSAPKIKEQKEKDVVKLELMNNDLVNNRLRIKR